MPETDNFDKQQIVSVLNKKYGTTIFVELAEVAVLHGLTSWDALRMEAQAPCECGCSRLALGGMMEAAHPEDYRDDERA